MGYWKGINGRRKNEVIQIDLRSTYWVLTGWDMKIEDWIQVFVSVGYSERNLDNIIFWNEYNKRNLTKEQMIRYLAAVKYRRIIRGEEKLPSINQEVNPGTI